MDAIVIILMAVVFCLMSQRGAESIQQTIEQVQAESADLEVKLNDQFVQEEHAFEVIAHGLNFC